MDITCDSDGQIKQYIGAKNNASTMPIHDISPNEEYFLGIFLTGAYQDIMGDTHNLFGRVNEVHIYCDDEDPEDYYIEEFIPGNTSAQILQTLQYSPPFMATTVKKAIEQKMKEGKIRPKEAVALTDFYEERLHDYTYLK